MEPQVVLSERYTEAVGYAARVHAHQSRKGTDVAYVSHLLGASSLVLEAGGDEDLAIAALLHDAAEDHGGEERLRDIADRFGPRVADIVRASSDSLAPKDGPKEDWEVRKRRHLDHLARSPRDVWIVWAADKVHNGRAIVTDLQAHGPAAMDRFNAAPDRVLWYYEANLALAEEQRLPAALIVPLRDVVADLRELLG